MTTVERIARWAALLEPDDLPSRVVVLCEAQRQSVLAAIAASTNDAAASRVVEGIGDATVEDRLMAASALSIALDFDDYLCFGHTGHSSVLVPLFLGAETGAGPAERLLAQAVANEVEARLGGACLLGPLNGQLWSFIHAAGAALAAGRLLQLGPHRMAHALALSLYQAPRPTVPGFMAPDSKLLTAADPTLCGVRAARLAQAGVTGPLDVLDHRQGFLAAFAFLPLPAVLGGLGRAWATETLCIKPYPGCAYIDTTVDALLSLGPIDQVDVASVEIEAGIVTCGMDAMSRHYAGPRPSPVTVTFSIPWNVAIVLCAGELTPTQVSGPWLSENAGRLGDLVGRVRLRHSAELTVRTLEALLALLPPRAVLGRIKPARLLSALARVRNEHAGLPLGPRDLLNLLAILPRAARAASSTAEPWADPGAFRMTFPSRVRVQLRSGAVREASAEVPRGGAGHAGLGPVEAARAKFDTWARPLWGDVAEAEARIIAGFGAS